MMLYEIKCVFSDRGMRHNMSMIESFLKVSCCRIQVFLAHYFPNTAELQRRHFPIYWQSLYGSDNYKWWSGIFQNPNLLQYTDPWCLKLNHGYLLVTTADTAETKRSPHFRSQCHHYVTISTTNHPCFAQTMVSVDVVTTLSWRIKVFAVKL